MEALTRGGLAQQGRVNSETIRYYERCGLLPKPLPHALTGQRRIRGRSVNFSGLS